MHKVWAKADVDKTIRHQRQPARQKEYDSPRVMKREAPADIAMMMEENENLDYVLPENGSNLFYDAMCIPTCSKNKENAEKFINFMQKPDVAAENCKYLRYGCANDEAAKLLDADIRESELTFPPQEYLDKCYVFANLDDEVYEYMQEQFVKIQAE